MHSEAAVVITTFVIIAALLIAQTSSLPTTKKALDIRSPSTTTTGTNDVTSVISSNKAAIPPTSNSIDNKGYIRVNLDDGNLQELSAFATGEIRLRQKSADLSLKGVSFALKQISTSLAESNYKMTLVLANKDEKRSQFLICNVDIVHDASANQRRVKTDCLRANIVTGIQSIRPDGIFQEDADLAAAVFAANELNRQSNNSSPLTLVHYVASGSHEMISGTEYKLHMQVQTSPKDDKVLLCETSVLPRSPKMLHGTECGTLAGKDDSGSYSAADVKDADVIETAEFAANALMERQVAEAPDELIPVKVARVWKKPVRGIQRRLRMTLSDDAEGGQPSSYCLAVVFEDRLSGEYELVTGAGNTVCSPTPPTV
ncbi:uncharacterized protein LOC130693371 [Daphnia carinata]|uniref:uncharacterized protein LOC130693371 n=1 Tax=Daphnia carinata TaxID=120202 RepID=UPI00257BD12C|nr:uncharacterized protein LOC130693371 [Daphnia carinata]